MSAWRGAFITAGILVIATVAIAPDVIGTMESLHREVSITAHRGAAARAPENTIAAVRAAIEDGADYVEIDVQQTADGGLVLMHDLSLRRTTGRTEGVWQLTAEEITSIDAGRWYGTEFTGELVPTLEAVIDITRGEALLNIEIKLHGRERGVAQSLVNVLQQLHVTNECIVTSLDQAILAEIRAIDPSIGIGAIITAAVGDVSALDVDFLVVQPLIATPSYIARAHGRGQEVHVWSLSDPANIHTAIDQGADGILTPDPALGVAVRDSRTPEDDLRALLVRLFGRAGRMVPAPDGWE
jgi:glycerophosphoryl diester phosphodiesterase